MRAALALVLVTLAPAAAKTVTGRLADADTGPPIPGATVHIDDTTVLLDGEPVLGRTAGTLAVDRLTVAGVERVEVAGWASTASTAPSSSARAGR